MAGNRMATKKGVDEHLVGLDQMSKQGGCTLEVVF
jgi:hypothetical protein